MTFPASEFPAVGRQSFELKRVSLDKVPAAASGLLEAELIQQNAKIVVPRPLPSVLGAATLLQVVFQNLIGNSITFVAPKTTPQLEIIWMADRNHVTVFFTANGLGIPEEARSHVFNLFERIHPGLPGTGIEFRIVHRAIERLQGKIGLNAAPNGRGAQFWIRLAAA